MADGEYMRFAHGRCSLPVSAAKPQQSGSSKPKCSQCGEARSRTKPHEVSVLCRECYRKSVGYVPPVVRRCLWCLATYVPKDAKVRLGKSGGWFCSRECSFADRALHGRPDGNGTRTAWREYGLQFESTPVAVPVSSICVICLNPSGRIEKACAGACADRRVRVAHCVEPVPCRACETVFCRLPGTYSRHCSESCQQTWDRDARKAERKRRGSTNNRKRARKFGGIVETFNPIEVLTRDRWRCQLCGVKTPKAKRGSIEDNAPELDHIVPLSKGGGHTRANTQCLCRRCNGLKSDAARGQLSFGW